MLAKLYKISKEYKKAISALEKVIAIDEKIYGNINEETTTSKAFLAEIHGIQGSHHKSVSLLKEALKAETYLIQREVPTMAREDRSRYLETLGYTYEKAFSESHKSNAGAEIALFARLNRHGLLEETEKRQARLLSSTSEAQGYALKLKYLTKELSSLSLTIDERKSIRKELDDLERRLYRILPEYKPRVLEIKEIASKIPSRGTLIEFQKYQPFRGELEPNYQWQDAQYVALILDSNAKVQAIDLGPAEPIEKAIEQALLSSESRAPNAVALWKRVGNLVIKPLAKALRKTETLIISPDAELNRIPFAALPDPYSSNFISDTFQLRIVTTGRELIDLEKANNRKTLRPLIVANPDFNAELHNAEEYARKYNNTKNVPVNITVKSHLRSRENYRLTWEELPGTAKEGKAVSSLINGQLLTRQGATASEIQNTAARKVLHIASHAFYLPNQQDIKENAIDDTFDVNTRGRRSLNIKSLSNENPLLRSGIALAGANQIDKNQTGPSSDDGYLTALEVTQLDWQGTELVVISACESGQGEIKAGEGVYGPKRAIAVSGARSSLLSLWKVDDMATAAFMKYFYQQMKDGMGRSEALSATQEYFRNHPIPAWQHPNFWAAFQLSGDWRPIKNIER